MTANTARVIVPPLRPLAKLMATVPMVANNIAGPKTNMEAQSSRHARRLRRIFDFGFPDLLAALGVARHRGAVGGNVDDAFVDEQLANCYRVPHLKSIGP
jgi:hypothetical protein